VERPYHRLQSPSHIVLFLLLQDVGAMLGMLTLTWVASRFNRRTVFFLVFSFCLAVVAFAMCLIYLALPRWRSKRG